MRPIGECTERRLAITVRDATGATVRQLPVDAFAVAVPLFEEERVDAFVHAAQAQEFGDRPMLELYLGRLATDLIGYCSWDIEHLASRLERLAATQRSQLSFKTGKTAKDYYLRGFKLQFPGAPPYWILPHESAFVPESVVYQYVPLPKAARAPWVGAWPSLQSPSIDDWRVSPGSFAVNLPLFVGQEGCETLVPASLAVHQYNFFSIVRLTDAQGALPDGKASNVSLGYAHEYVVEWFQLGHSLGTLAHSTPLAPGETIKLAIIDWTRKATGSRLEGGYASERLSHETHRDRLINETVSTALRETQKGRSVMMGKADSAGASASLGGVLGGAAGTAMALGYAASATGAARTLAGEMVQRLADNFSQASSAVREYQTTVVIEATQQETEKLSTRVLTNYNHAHAMTILYYEILRHYRVVTRLVRTRPVLLLKQTLPNFLSLDDIVNHRSVLAEALLETDLVAAIDEAVRYYDALKAAEAIPKPASDMDLMFDGFLVEIATGGNDEALNRIFMEASGIGGERLAHLVHRHHARREEDPETSIFHAGAFVRQHFNDTFFVKPANEIVPGTTYTDTRVRYGDLWGFRMTAFVLPGAPDEWQSGPIRVHGRVANSDRPPVLLVDVPSVGAVNQGKAHHFDLPCWRPSPLVAAPAPTRPASLDRLHTHLVKFRHHYARAIWLAEEPTDRAGAFANLPWDGTSTVLDQVENRVLDAFGPFVAYPCTNQDIAAKIASQAKLEEDKDRIEDERLITLPARGVFAEAKLGHCNSAEIIDDTRFWDWQKSPIPEKAPEIAPLQAGQHEQPDVDTTPTGFPTPLVNIVGPTAAPDPTGLAAAFGTLSALGAFRDAPTAELAGLLGKLSDNSVEIAKVANAARTAGALNQLSENEYKKGAQTFGQHQQKVSGNLEAARGALPSIVSGSAGAGAAGAEAGAVVGPGQGATGPSQGQGGEPAGAGGGASAGGSPGAGAGGSGSGSQAGGSGAGAGSAPQTLGEVTITGNPVTYPEGDGLLLDLTFVDSNNAALQGKATVYVSNGLEGTKQFEKIINFDGTVNGLNSGHRRACNVTAVAHFYMTNLEEHLRQAFAGAPITTIPVTGPISGTISITPKPERVVRLRCIIETAEKEVEGKEAKEAEATARAELSGELAAAGKAIKALLGMQEVSKNANTQTVKYKARYIVGGAVSGAGGLNIEVLEP